MASQFLSTRWSLVLAAADSQNHARSRRALNELCGTYWPPLYAYIRCKGHSPQEAEDLTQEFFSRMLEKKDLVSADRTKGKFRSFLLASLQHFLANEWDKRRAKKRGGGRVLRPLDTSDAECRYCVEPVDDMTPELLFNRRWALVLLDNVLKRLRKEYIQNKKEHLFEGIKKSLTQEPDAPTYAHLAQQLGMETGAVKTAAHRLRRRYEVLMRDEIAQTMTDLDPQSVKAEIRELWNSL